jgi:hypothetical protein
MQQLKQSGPKSRVPGFILTEPVAEKNQEKRLAYAFSLDRQVTKAHFHSLYLPPPVVAMTSNIKTSISS